MRLEESDESRLRLRVRMGLHDAGTIKPGLPRSSVDEIHTQHRRGVNRRPGQRRAKRDPIGIGAVVHGV